MENKVLEKYAPKFEALLAEMEKEDGKNLYEISIHQFGTWRQEDCTKLGYYKNRPFKIAVTMKDEKFRELDGTYDSIGALERKIEHLRYTDLFEEVIEKMEKTGHLGRCKSCHEYERNFVETNCCQRCSKSYLDCKWNRIRVYEYSGTIVEVGYGSYALIENKGSFKFILS
jgi:hypothetical protein